MATYLDGAGLDLGPETRSLIKSADISSLIPVCHPSPASETSWTQTSKQITKSIPNVNKGGKGQRKKKRGQIQLNGEVLRERLMMVQRTQWEAVYCSRLCFTINESKWLERTLSILIFSCWNTGRLIYFAASYLSEMPSGLVVVLLAIGNNCRSTWSHRLAHHFTATHFQCSFYKRIQWKQ